MTGRDVTSSFRYRFLVADTTGSTRWGSSSAAFRGAAVVVSTRDSTPSGCVGPVTRFIRPNAGNNIVDWVDSNIIEDVACHLSTERCQFIYEDSDKCDDAAYSRREFGL